MNYSTIRRIRLAAAMLQTLPDDALRKKSLELKFDAMSGRKIGELVVPGFSLVVEASRRCLGQIHYDVQLLCGICLTQGRIAEMKTGDGKTLTAALAATVFALYGKGVHVVTFNDYLAARDQEFLRPVYELLDSRLTF